MKKLFAIFIAAILLFVGCAKIEDMSIKNANDEKIEISFDLGKNAVAPKTRAIVTGTSFTEGNFGVYGYVKQNADLGDGTSGKFLMKKAKYSATTGSAVEGTYYWPQSDNNTTFDFNFVAIYPYEKTPADVNGSNQLVVDVTADPTSDKFNDILYAVASLENHQVVGTYDNTDPTKHKPVLTFRHALSFIEFQGAIKAGNNITAVNIQKIEFLSATDGTKAGINTTNTLTFDIPNISTNTTSNPKYVPSYGTAATPVNTLNFAENVSGLPLNTSSYKILDSVIFVPQTTPAYVRITFDITIANTTGETIVYKGRQVTKAISDGSTDMATTPNTYENWAAGYKYVYRWCISAEGVDFTISVDNWTKNSFQVWDHDATAYVEHFFDKASTQMVPSLAIA